MPREVDNIEIQGPPIDEIQKRSSCLKRSCGSLLIIVLIILGLAIFFIRFVVTPHAKKLVHVPDTIPQDIPLYDEDNLDAVLYTSGDERRQAIEFLGFVPKPILSPIIVAIENTDIATGTERETLWESFIRILGTPIGDHRDVVQIEWSDLQAKPSFLHAYYATSLEAVGYEETTERLPNRSRFYNDTDDTTVILETRDNASEEDGTDYAILTIYYSRS